MKTLIRIILLVLCAFQAFGQTEDTIPKQLRELTISGYKNESARFSPLNISRIELDSLQGYTGFTICDALKKTEGVSVLSSGIGIAKPVIRGLYGNRVLVLLNGLKFDNQQWQEEHGLGLSSFGLSRVELIKGPIGILYGTEAIGGVINLIEEERPAANTQKSDLALTLHSNTLGGMVQAGYLQGKETHWWRIRVGIDNHADYSDGNKQRVLNSRFDGYYLKSTYGFERKKWVSTNNYSFSMNRFGFILDDIYTFITPDKRWSRQLSENPAHLVFLNILSSENKIAIRKDLNLSANLGIQSNERMENEGSGAISLNMHLLTLQGLLKLDYERNEKHHFIFSSLHSFEDNTNFGSRKIVPDAHMQESNISVNYEYKPHHKLVLENGVGIGFKSIHTFFTAGVNGQGKEVQPFQKTAPYYNLFSGISYNPNKALNLKFNLATGVRVANLVELSSNGLHEGIFTYEIGDPTLKNEQIYSLNLFLNEDHSRWGFSVSPFYNYFTNYIYLCPVNEQWFGFPVFRYKQQNAIQYGAELTAYYKPNQNSELKLAYSGMDSKTRDGKYTPYIPAQKLMPQINYRLQVYHRYNLNLNMRMEYYFAQNHTAPNEKSTGSYSLWYAGVSSRFFNQKLSLGLQVNNLFNTPYIDHLSRFKNYGLLNIGRNIILSLKYCF